LRVFLSLSDEESLRRFRDEGIAWVDSPDEAEATLGDSAPATLRAGRGPRVLSAREEEILGYVADGWSSLEIASRLGLSQATVKFHLRGIYRKLGVSRRTEAVREGLKLGIVDI
jgi:Response regulator containing a CheY-like receiver domain and an HTH DNA-binding domain